MLPDAKVVAGFGLNSAPFRCLMIDPKKLKPLMGKVLLEALVEPDMKSGLYLPLEAQERYPQAGWIRAVGKGSELSIGDIAVIPTDGTKLDTEYFLVGFVLLSSGDHLQFDAEAEPVVRETIEGYKRRGENRVIKIKTIEEEQWAFTVDEVVDSGLQDANAPGFKIDYVNVAMLTLREDGIEKLFYFADEADILVSIHMEEHGSS